jgi:hypothetical protein
MFDIVATDEEKPPPRVNGGIFDHCEPWLASAHRAAESRAAESAQRPCRYADQSQHDKECQEKAYGEWHLRAEQIKHPPNSPCRSRGPPDFPMVNSAGNICRREY